MVTFADTLNDMRAMSVRVSSIYNTQYANGVRLYGPAKGLAHAHAIQASLIQLRTEANYASLVREDHAVDALFASLT